MTENGIVTFQDVISMLEKLIAGQVTKEQASDWAWQVMQEIENRQPHDNIKFDSNLWEALCHLFGCDMRIDKDTYLHGLSDFEAWLEELKGLTPK